MDLFLKIFANIFAIFSVWCVRNRFVTTASVKAVVQWSCLMVYLGSS